MSTVVLDPSHRGVGMLPRLPGDRETRIVATALTVQAALLVALAMAFGARDQEVRIVEQPMQISVVQERTLSPRPTPVLASPKTKVVAEVPKPDRPVDQSDTSDRKVVDDVRQGGGSPSSPGGLIWTPPVPVPNPALSIDRVPDDVKRVVMPVVEMKKGAADPQLVSYDQGRFSDAASVRAAAQLSGTGSIVMNVAVSVTGDVTSCQTQISSGSALLDQKGCDLIRSYRYRPAQDAEGRPKAATVSEVLEWARDGQFVNAQAGGAGGISAVDAAAVAARTQGQVRAQQPQPLRVVTMPGSPRHP